MKTSKIHTFTIDNLHAKTEMVSFTGRKTIKYNSLPRKAKKAVKKSLLMSIDGRWRKIKIFTLVREFNPELCDYKSYRVNEYQLS